jgi:hypothetical protein
VLDSSLDSSLDTFLGTFLDIPYSRPHHWNFGIIFTLFKIHGPLGISSLERTLASVLLLRILLDIYYVAHTSLNALLI